MLGCAGLTAEVDPLLVDRPPQLAGNGLEKVPLRLERRGRAGQAQARGDAIDVRVHGNALDAMERLVEHDVRRLASHAGKARELLHGAGHLPTIVGNDHLGSPDAVRRLRAPEADGADDLAELCGIGLGHGFGRGPAAEQLGRDLVHGHVGGLRREQHANHERERVMELQRAFDVGIQLAHPPAELDGALAPELLRLAWHVPSSICLRRPLCPCLWKSPFPCKS